MLKFRLLFMISILTSPVFAQIYLADNGLTATGTGTSQKVSLGGTLANATTEINFGSANNSSTLVVRKGTTNYFSIVNTGNIGIGTNTPSARLHLSAGTSTLAAFKLTSGVNLTTPSAGSMEYDGSNLYFTPTTTRKTMAFADFSNMTYAAPVSLINPATGASASTVLTLGNVNATNQTMSLYYGNGGNNVFGALTANILANAGTIGGMNISVTADAPLKLSTNNLTRLSVTGAGNVGIGTTNPSNKFEVSNGINSFKLNPNASVFTISGPTSTLSETPRLNIGFNSDNDVAMGLSAYSHDNLALTFDSYHNGSGWVSSSGGSNFSLYKFQDELLIGFNAGTPKSQSFSGFNLVDGVHFSKTGSLGVGRSPNINAKLDINGNIFSNGKIAIGTTDMAQIGTYALAVNGDAIFNKVKVKLYGGWADYVFEDAYELPSLASVESFIKKNKHLPDVPSAAEVEKNGIDIAENQIVLLKKVEELTLYIIEQHKKSERQQLALDALMKELDVLKEKIK